MLNIMLDLETWGTTPGSDIRSIGACVFDPNKGETPLLFGDSNRSDAYTRISNANCFYIATGNPIVADHNGYGDAPVREYTLRRDPKTVEWWNDQTDEARAAFADPIDLREALQRFTSWICNAVPVARTGTHEQPDDDIRLWSHGGAAQSSFDIAILYAAYEAVGLPVPWHYRAPRDTRTLFDAAGITNHSAHLAAHPGPLGIPHHALDDAICQARAVCAATARLNEWRTTHDAVFTDVGCGGAP